MIGGIMPPVIITEDTVEQVKGADQSVHSENQGVLERLWGSIKKDLPDIMNAVIGSSGVCTSQGMTGGFATYLLPISCRVYYTAQVTQDNDRWGKPLCAKDKISNHSGYVLCATGELEVNATKAEREDIARYLTGGFYYE